MLEQDLVYTGLSERNAIVLSIIAMEFSCLAKHMFFSTYAPDNTVASGFNFLLLRDEPRYASTEHKETDWPIIPADSASFFSVEEFLGDYIIAYDACHWHVPFTETRIDNPIYSEKEWQDSAHRICHLISDIMDEKLIVESFWGENANCEAKWLRTRLIFSRYFNNTRVLPEFKGYDSIRIKHRSWNSTYDSERTY